jgi:DNA-binding NtrC family response regulator
VEEAVSALKEGVTDFLTKPLKDPDALRTLVRRTLESHRRELALTALRDKEVAGMPSEKVLFAGAAMVEVRRLIANVADTPASVLISGESGTGKELVARMIHRASPRHDAGFVAINCAAIPENLMESELFGHEKGAFTGATQARPGKFELATGGTLFLDEIGELPMALQAKLLRVLQERTFERLGGFREIRADVRIIAATNRELATEIREKRFREDLFYRLNVFPIHLPPLRERRDALPILTEYLVLRAAQQIGKTISVVEAEVHAAFADYDWPGNIRELQNVIERAVILSSGRITLSELPKLVRRPGKQSLAATDGRLQERERETILEMLAQCGGNRRLAAERLGISKRTLQYRLKDYGLTDG